MDDFSMEFGTWFGLQGTLSATIENETGKSLGHSEVVVVDMSNVHSIKDPILAI